MLKKHAVCVKSFLYIRNKINKYEVQNETKFTILFFFFASFTMMAQTVIKGKVTDGKEAVIGANVSIKGTTEGTVTDIDGKFEIPQLNNLYH
jgi:hypothetical protein